MYKPGGGRHAVRQLLDGFVEHRLSCHMRSRYYFVIDGLAEPAEPHPGPRQICRVRGENGQRRVLGSRDIRGLAQRGSGMGRLVKTNKDLCEHTSLPPD